MRAELRDSLEFLYPDSDVGERPRRAMRLDVARGGTASVHVLFNGLTVGKAVRLEVRRNGRPVPEAQWFRLIDVPVEANTGPDGFVEKEGKRNRFVIRRAPFRVYDAMAPLGASLSATASTMAVRLHLPVARDARAGRRTYTLDTISGGEERTLSLVVAVHTAVIPPAGRDSLPYTNWFLLDHMATRHGLEPWSDAHWRMIRRYADLLVRARQNTFLVPIRDVFIVRRGEAVLDRARLRRLVRTFIGAGMHFIEGGHLAARTGGDWQSPTHDLLLTGERATSPEGNAALARVCRQLVEEIDRNGWRDRWLQHIADEPWHPNAADYRILAGMVRKYMRGIPILDATMHLELAGAVDVWCPQAHEYQKHRARFDAQRALGDRVWFYTCCVPGGPWLNRLLDMELLRPALFGWAAALYGLDGFLHWGLNWYKPEQDPFEQSVVDHGGGMHLPAGDTHVVYPGARGPWSSLRLEAQREGFEDYELVQQLRRRNPKRATAIVGRVIRGFDKYTADVKVFRAARRALLREA